MSAIFSTFNNLKVSTKISLGFAAVLLITIVVGVNAYLGVAHIGEDIGHYTQRVAVVDAVSEIDREFLSYRRLVREVATTDDAAKSAAEEEARVRDAIERAEKEIHNPERHAKVKEIKERFAEYATLAQKAATLIQEKSQIGHDVLDADGKRLREDLEDLLKTAASEGDSNTLILGNEVLKDVMQIRLSVNMMLGRHDLHAKETADRSFADVKTVMAELDKQIKTPAARKDFDEIQKLVAEYHVGYEKAAHIDQELDTLQSKEMPVLAGTIADDATSIRKGAVADEHKYKDDAISQIDSTEATVLWSLLAGVLVGAVLSWLIGRGIATPIQAIAGVLLELANGNKMVDVPFTDRRDEVGENARAARSFKDNLIRMEQMEGEKQESERRAAEQRKRDMHHLADEFQRAVGGIVETVATASSQLENAANSLTKTAETTQQLSGMVASASEQTSVNVQGVAAASEELSSTVTEISRQVQQSSIIASQAVAQASKTNERVYELSQSADRIGDVIGLINTIAGQTNLLALNATIEAARAGDAGKGFAVVAQEVKALAAQTSKATSDIAAQISGMQTATSDAVNAIREITETINKISEISGAIAAAVEEQGATTQEISRNVSEAAKGTSEVASSITDVSRGANETGAASSQVFSSAKQLSSESASLRREVDRFLSNVRAA